MIFCKKLHFFLLFSVVCLVFLSACASFMPAMTETRTRPVIILDAGHGGRDSGAVAEDGTLEKNLNLALTEDTAVFLDILGVTPVPTRTDDSDTDGNPLSFSKRDDIFNRLALSEQYPDSLFVSLHVNYSTSARDKGFTVFYGTQNEKSKEAADAVWQAASSSRLCTRVRDVAPAPQTVYLQHHVASPCLLVEFGFLSNEEDLALLKDDVYRQKLAFMLAQAVAK